MLYRAKCDKDEGIFKGVKNIGTSTPIGYEAVQDFFVDNSGFGSESELALTPKSFLAKVRKGFYYGITGVGQFQVYIAEFKKILKSRKELYAEMGILKSKLVKNNTRITEYVDGKKVLRLHSTDIITWTADGKIVLNSGGWRTHTTKARINEYLPLDIRIYQKNYKWYIIKNKDYTNKIEFVDGMTI